MRGLHRRGSRDLRLVRVATPTRRCSSVFSGAGPILPVIHELAPDLPEVCYLQPDASGSAMNVGGILGVIAGLRYVYARLSELTGGAVYGDFVDHPEARVVQPR